MIKAHIDSDGMKCLDIPGSAPTIVAEFGLIINQYYSAISKSATQLLHPLRLAFASLVAPDSPVEKQLCLSCAARVCNFVENSPEMDGGADK